MVVEGSAFGHSDLISITRQMALLPIRLTISIIVSFRWVSAVFLDNFTLAHRKLSKWKNMMAMLGLFGTNNTSPNIY